jgi:hypothetical protein
MKRFIGIALVLVVGISLAYGQTGPNTPFAPSSSSSAGQPPAPSAFGGGGVTDDINPPPDPIDTPIDAGVIYLLIIGTAYGVTRIRNEKRLARI